MASEIVIRINGVDITDDVIIEGATFTSQASGSPGVAEFKIRDMFYAHSYVVGQTLTLDIDGVRHWGGWIQSIQRQYFFPYTGSPLITMRRTSGPNAPCGDVAIITELPRAIVIKGIDYNILLRKRFAYDKVHPERAELKSWPAGTHDDVMIRYFCENNLDLSGDGIDYVTKVDYVGTPNPDERGNPAGGGHSWENVMRAIARYPGAIYYINPDRQLVYADVDVPNAAYKLTDIPEAGDELGYREMEILYNGANLMNDAMVWGAGQGAKRVKFRRTRDATSVAEHGLWQVGDFREDMWRQASVDKRSNSFVYGSKQNKRGGKDDAVSVVLALFNPSFRVADKVDFTSNVFGFNDVIPIRRSRIMFPTPTEARFDLVLSHYIDEPWNTFEYWFPKLKLPPIAIPTIGGSDGCPVENYPQTYEYNDNIVVSLGSFFAVFSDDMRHETGTQPDNGVFGWWTYGYNSTPWPPNIENNRMTISSHRIYLPNPISSDWQIVAALDLTAWASGSHNLNIGPGHLSSNGDFWLDDSPTPHPKIATSRLRGMVYIRIVTYRTLFTAMKIWPIGSPEPSRWDVTADMSGAGNVVNYVPINVAYGLTKLAGITLFASRTQGDTTYVDQEMFVNFAYGLDDNGWEYEWAFPDPEDQFFYPMYDWALNVPNSNVETHSNTENPSHSGTLYWGSIPPGGGGLPSGLPGIADFVAGYGPGYLHDLNQKLSSIAVAGPDRSAPARIRISGLIGGWMGRSMGVGNSRQREQHVLQVSVYVYSYGDGKPFWSEWMAYGRPLGQASAATLGLSITSEYGGFWGLGSNPPIPFQFDFYYGDYSQNNQSGSLQWGIALWDPQSKMREMSPEGQPIMSIPNNATFKIQTSGVQITGIWNTEPSGGGMFCASNATHSGTTGEVKTCEGVPINTIHLNELYKNGERWAVALQGPYQPGSVEVMVDGLPAKPALDFIELDPLIGIIEFLNSFLNAKSMTVCYFPET